MVIDSLPFSSSVLEAHTNGFRIPIGAVSDAGAELPPGKDDEPSLRAFSVSRSFCRLDGGDERLSSELDALLRTNDGALKGLNIVTVDYRTRPRVSRPTRVN